MIGDVRRLIYGLRPATLDQLGLAASLRGLAVAGVLAGNLRHDRRSELAAPAPRRRRGGRLLDRAGSTDERRGGTRMRSTCSVRMAVEPTVLRLEIADDGGGSPADRRASGSTR